MEKLKLKDFLEYNYLSTMKLSENGKNIAFIKHKAKENLQGYDSNIWLFDTENENFRRLTTGGEEKNFIWLDNENIIFPCKRDERINKKIEEGENWTSFYKININGGEAEKYFDIPLNVRNIKILDKDRFLLLAQYDINDLNINSLVGEEREKAIKSFKENKDYEIFDEIPFWANGGGFINKKRDRLFIFDKNTKNIIEIGDKYTNVEYFTVYGDFIYFVGNTYTDKKEKKDGIYRYNMLNKKLDTLLKEEKYRVSFVEIIGEKLICALNDMSKYGTNQNPEFFVLEDGKIELLKENDTWLVSTVGSDCRYGSNVNFQVKDEKLYYITTINHSSFLCSLDTLGNVEILSKDNGSVDGFVVGEKIFFIGMKNHKLQEIYIIENGEERQISSFNEEIITTKTISNPEKFNFINDVGMEIEGWVIKPIDYDNLKKYPAILDIHGGPKTVYGDVFYHEMQVWANLGYFVFYCNPRGGDGRGNEFADIRGKYGTVDYDDLMLFTDKVIEKYNIDVEKIGVTGGSYGGFMTNWIIGHTDRFACAVSQRSIANWISKFGTTDIGYYFNVDQIGATPWSDYDKMWWHSPMKYADKVKTPTLFIHSQEDYRCWLPEGIQMFTSLKYNGIPARLCMFRGENHELSRSGKPNHRVKRLEEITSWFEKYLK